MAEVVARSGAGLVAMHMRGTPETMQTGIHYADLLGEVRGSFERILEHARRCGIADRQIVLDPGIGFGKRLEHNLLLLARPDAFDSLGRPLLVGASRKSMFRDLLHLDVNEREEASLAVVAICAFLGVSILRVHDVRAAVRAARVAHALREARRSGEEAHA
jgi:dihydropteroate synthase